MKYPEDLHFPAVRPAPDLSLVLCQLSYFWLWSKKINVEKFRNTHRARRTAEAGRRKSGETKVEAESR